MATLTIELDQASMVRQVAALEVVSSPQAKAWARQTVNRVGKSMRTQVVQNIAAALPVKRKYINARVKWWNQGGNSPGKLRVYGRAGRIKARNMKPKYPIRESKSVEIGWAKTQSKRQLRAAVRRAKRTHTRDRHVTFGVGGRLPGAQKRTVLRGFAVAAGTGYGSGDVGGRSRTFVSATDPRFPAMVSAGKLLIMQRVGQHKTPIVNADGAQGQVVTAGAVFKLLGKDKSIPREMRIKIKREYGERVAREITAIRKRGAK